jgi:hypothetical protein
LKNSPGGGQDPYDEEDGGDLSGTPKKIKQELDALQAPEKLFACPFCKFDKARYSEQNVHEKHYRGCSSGYWPDLSRLKQHLYRVHRRGIHCVRCYTKFDRKELLDQHVRDAQPCNLVECPWPEKFDEAQYNDIRRKRPANTPEQVWYTIYRILFPGEPQPQSPYADNVEPPPSSMQSPGVPECQDTMDVLGKVFESRLNQHIEAPGQPWLRSREAREFILRQLKASMADVLQQLQPGNSPAVGNPSIEVSPYSANTSEYPRRNSISLTPASSVPPSPVKGPESGHASGSDMPFILPGHRQSFSRPFPAREALKVSVPQSSRTTRPQHVPPVNQSSTAATFQVPVSVDPENDCYDEECHSWSHGDELGLAISTDFDFQFNPSLASAVDELRQMQCPSAPNPISTFEFTPVKLSSVADAPVSGSTTVASQLKTNHSTTSSVDSGYGSLGHASALSSSSRPSLTAPGTDSKNRPTRDRMKGKSREEMKESSPVPESDINFAALGVPFQEFFGGDANLGMDELGNVGGETLSAYLDTRYSF